jgi:hypothetical protein
MGIRLSLAVLLIKEIKLEAAKVKFLLYIRKKG